MISSLIVSFATILTAVWLRAATDDTEPTFSTNFEDYYPTPERADKSFALLISLSKTLPKTEIRITEKLGEQKSISELNDIIQSERFKNLSNNSDFDPYKLHKLSFEETIEYLVIHEADVEKLWEELSGVEPILEELNSFEAISCGPMPYPLEPDIELRPFREIAKRQSWRAYILHHHGFSELALNELHRILSISSKAIGQSRAPIETFNWIAVSNISLDAAKNIASEAAISAESIRTGLAATQLSISPFELLERNLRQELIFFSSILESAPKATFLGYPLFLPNETANFMARYTEESIILLQTEDAEGFRKLTKEFSKKHSRFSLRNPAGRRFLTQTILNPELPLDLYQKSFATRTSYQTLLQEKLKLTQSNQAN